MLLAKCLYLCLFTHHPLIIQEKYDAVNHSRSLSKCQSNQHHGAIIHEPFYHSYFFFLISIFFSKIKWILPGGIWICLKAIIITKCKRTLLRTLLFDDFLLFGLQTLWESLKTLAIYFFLCGSMFCIFLFQSVRRNYFCLRAPLLTQMSIYFLLKPSCPSQWQRWSDPQMMRETASCRAWKWIGSISSDSWHFQKYIYKTKYIHMAN